MIGPETFQTIVKAIGNLASIVGEISNLRKGDKNDIEPKILKLSEITATIVENRLKMMEYESELRKKVRKLEEEAGKSKKLGVREGTLRTQEHRNRRRCLRFETVFRGKRS